MYVCNCNGVTEREIRQAVELGADSLAQVSAELGVATCCGRCRCDAKRVIREHKAEMRALGAACPA